MRQLLLTVCLSVAVSGCGGSGAAVTLPSIDGLWSAFTDSQGSTLTLRLSAVDTAVSGTGTYSVGALRTGTVTVGGSYRPPAAALTITYDHGEVATFTGTVTDSDRMKGTLTARSGAAIEIEFVRP
jgi:hypothetical protein